MSGPERLRVAVEAARLLYSREHKEYFHAKREAARRLGAQQLPTNREVHDQLIALAEALGGSDRVFRLLTMRKVALDYMRLLQEHEPRLIGSVLTGHIREGSDIDLHFYTDDPLGLYEAMEEAGLTFEVETVRARKRGEVMEFVHVYVLDPRGHTLECTVYPHSWLYNQPRSGVTGGPLHRAPASEVEALVAHATDPP